MYSGVFWDRVSCSWGRPWTPDPPIAKIITLLYLAHMFFLFCMCVWYKYTFVLVCMYVWVCVHVCAMHCGGQISGVFYYCRPLDFLRQGRSLNLELTSLAGRTPSVCLSLLLRHWDYRCMPLSQLLIITGCWRLGPGPHTCTARPLLAEPVL